MRGLREEIMAGYGQVDHEEKDDRTVVTEIDKAVEQKIVDALLAEFPDIGVYGEEHGKQGSEERYWLIDPIDGTESYVRGLPGVTTIIGLVEDGEVTQSYIYDPVEDVLYSAYKGQGAFADEEEIHVSKRPINRATIYVGSSTPLQRPEIMRAIKDAGVFYVGLFFGAGIKALYVATGKIEGNIYIEHGGHDWDHLPTRMLAEEAGAIFTELPNDQNKWSYAVLAPGINDTIIEAVQRELHA